MVSTKMFFPRAPQVSGYHYGLLTCESCKGFFKRTVQNKKVYTCVADRSCVIDKTQRKRCPYCRFQKCLDVGMKLEAVRHDRMRGGRNKFGPMYKRDRARKLQVTNVLRQRQLSQGGGGGMMHSPNTGLYPITSSSSWGQPNPIIKQEIQIREVSSLTSSPDSSPSPGQSLPLGSLGGGAGQSAHHHQHHHHQHHHQQQLAAQQTKQTWQQLGQADFPMSPPVMNKDFSYSMSSSSSGGAGNTGGGLLCTVASTSTSAAAAVQAKIPAPIKEFLKSLDDQEWQSSLYSLLQNQTFNQVEVDLFELLCKVLDQNLFAQVDWARNSYYFKELKVDDQMKLLQESWSEMLILDHLHHRLHNNLPDETQLPNGQKFELLSLALLGVPSMAEKFMEVTASLQALKFDTGDYVCLKFILLLNAEVRNLNSRAHVQECSEQVHQILLEYSQSCYPTIPEKYNSLLSVIPELKSMAQRGEEYLYFKHIQGNAPHATLLMEMLLAKRRQVM